MSREEKSSSYFSTQTSSKLASFSLEGPPYAGILVLSYTIQETPDSYACHDQSTSEKQGIINKKFDIQQIFAPSILLSNSTKWKLDTQHLQKPS